MMRWLIGLLLLGNFLLFLWINLRPPAVPPTPQPLPEIGELRIIGEADQAEGPPVSEGPATVEAPPESAPLIAATGPEAAPPPPAPEPADSPLAGPADSVAAQPGPEVLPAPAGEPAAIPPGAPETEPAAPVAAALPPEPPPAPELPVAGEPEPEPKSQAAPAGEPEPAPGPPPETSAAAEPEPAVEPEPTAEPQTASEPETEPAEQSAAQDPGAAALEAAPEDAPAVVAAPPMVCGELRGFEQETTAEELAERLRAADVTAEVLESVEQEQSGYWVLIPPASSRAAADQALQRLETAGVKDTWLVPAGPLKYAISLGLYSGSVRAGRRAEQIQALGLPAEVRPRMRDVTRYKISYRGEPQQLATVFEATGLQPDVTDQRLPCE
jgi:hypothetical protein